eukprot:Rmarinus@m.12687
MDWKPHEDELLVSCVKRIGEKWKNIASNIPNRSSTECRERWIRYLHPKQEREWQPNEDELLLRLVSEKGKAWSEISKHLTDRKPKSARDRYSVLTRSARAEATDDRETQSSSRKRSHSQGESCADETKLVSIDEMTDNAPGAPIYHSDGFQFTVSSNSASPPSASDSPSPEAARPTLNITAESNNSVGRSRPRQYKKARRTYRPQLPELDIPDGVASSAHTPAADRPSVLLTPSHSYNLRPTPRVGTSRPPSSGGSRSSRSSGGRSGRGRAGLAPAASPDAHPLLLAPFAPNLRSVGSSVGPTHGTIARHPTGAGIPGVGAAMAGVGKTPTPRSTVRSGVEGNVAGGHVSNVNSRMDDFDESPMLRRLWKMCAIESPRARQIEAEAARQSKRC